MCCVILYTSRHNMNKKIKIINNILGSSRRVKDEHLYHCPFCKHHKKKMSVNFAKNYFKCWVCDARGKNIYRMVRRFGTYDQRQKWLELDGRLDLSEFDKFFAEINEKEIKQTISLPDEFVSLCNKNLPMSSAKALEYLRSRGITKKEILDWKIGYATGGKYGGRIIIPSFNWDGNSNYFIARSFVGHQRRYLNPPVGRDVVFNELFMTGMKTLTLSRVSSMRLSQVPTAYQSWGQLCEKTPAYFNKL